jgi:hypothetical protein
MQAPLFLDAPDADLIGRLSGLQDAEVVRAAQYLESVLNRAADPAAALLSILARLAIRGCEPAETAAVEIFERWMEER